MAALPKIVTELVDEVYAITLDPVRYDELMGCWGAYLQASLDQADLAPSPVGWSDASLERHFNRALELFDRLGRNRRTRLSADGLVVGLPVAALVVDQAQAIIAANAAALPYLRPDGARRLSALIIDDDAQARLQAWLDGRSPQAPRILLLPCRIGPEQAASCIVATRIDLARPPGLAGQPIDVSGGGHFLLTTIDLLLDDGIAAAFIQAYGLTQAEAEVALALTRGLTPHEVGQRRDVSLNTVRTQIKALLRKADAASLQDLVRIVSGFAACYAIGRQTSVGGPDRADASWQRRKSVLLLPDGRQLAYEDSGAAAGQPVLLLHNMLHGPGLTDQAVATASRKGWRFIGPSRPGFGSSDPVRNLAGVALVDAVVQDQLRLLDHLGIDQVRLLGHLSGGIYALRLAQLAPDRVRSLLLVSYLPCWDDRRIARMPTRPRLVALTARHVPRMLPFIARAGTAQIDAGGEDKLLHALHGEVAADLMALRRPEVRRLAVDGLQHTAKQNHEAFCLDCPLVLTDWLAWAQAVRVPARIILGSEDMFAQPEDAREFAQAAPQFAVTMVPGAGLNLLYTHWPEVFELLSNEER